MLIEDFRQIVAEKISLFMKFNIPNKMPIKINNKQIFIHLYHEAKTNKLTIKDNIILSSNFVYFTIEINSNRYAEKYKYYRLLAYQDNQFRLVSVSKLHDDIILHEKQITSTQMKNWIKILNMIESYVIREKLLTC